MSHSGGNANKVTIEDYNEDDESNENTQNNEIDESDENGEHGENGEDDNLESVEEERPHPHRKDKEKKKKKSKKHGISDFIEEEAEESEDEAGGKVIDDSSEEEEEGLDEYEKDGFVVDEPEEEEDLDQEGEGEGVRKKKKKKRHLRRLDDDDLDLLRENLGIDVPRRDETRQDEDDRRFKRLKKGKGDMHDTIKERLFGDDALDDEQEQEATAEDLNATRERDDLDLSEESEDDLDDFIVGADNKPIRRARRRRRSRGFSTHQMALADSIFGVSELDFGQDELEVEEATEPPKVRSQLEMMREIYEPGLLEEKHLTVEDELIRSTDIPERLQTHKGPTEMNEEKRAIEAEWILNAKFLGLINDDIPNHRGRILRSIAHVLRFLQEEHLEIPFIAQYRKNYFQLDLRLADLWEIYDQDERWAHLASRHTNLGALVLNIQVTPDDEEYLKQGATSEEMINDLYDHFHGLYGNEFREVAAVAKGIRATRKNFYATCKRRGLGQFTQKIGLTAKQLGENMIQDFQHYTPIDEQSTPMELAMENVDLQPITATERMSNDFEERYRLREERGKELLKNAQTMLAFEIAYDPNVRQSLRNVYEKASVLSTSPTAKGKHEIDAFHTYHTIKRIQGKPVDRFSTGVQYLEIIRAEREGFISQKIELAEFTKEEMLREMEKLFLTDNTTTSATLWNEVRRNILEESLKNFLLPALERELRRRLTEEAEERLIREISHKLDMMLLVRPYSLRHQSSSSSENDRSAEEEDEERRVGVRVLAFVHAGVDGPSMAVVLDGEGEVIQFLKLSYLAERKHVPTVSEKSTNGEDEQIEGKDRASDLNRLKAFIVRTSPRVIALAATSMDCKRFMDDLTKLIETLYREERKIKYSIPIVWMDPDVALIYRQAERAVSEFPDYSTNLRMAISIGRRLQDPLTELAGLCNDSNEITLLRLHPLQEMVSKERLLRYLHRGFINVVNGVGVDINRMTSHKHASSTLQFVAGMGSRKAEALLAALYKRGGKVVSRSELATLLGPKVYQNCAGFIQIREKHFRVGASANEDLDPLDDTRVHPEDYQLARKMAADALDKDGQLNEDFLSYTYEIIRRPRKLEDIDLDAFAEILAQNAGETHKKQNLYDIKAELTHPFAEFRREPGDPTPDQLFYLLTHETPETLRPGVLVTARPWKSSGRYILCRLDNGLMGFLSTRDLSDEVDGQDPDKFLEGVGKGGAITCRVVNVKPDRFALDLTCRGADLASKRWDDEIWTEANRNDEYLVPDTHRTKENDGVDVELEKEKTELENQRIKNRTTRVVGHPLWKIMAGHKEAEEYLAPLDIGEVCFRSSAKGWDHITISWKFYDDVYMHVDVQERDKPNLFSLGKSFYIEKRKFDSLDEITARYIESMAMYVKDMIRSKYFKATPIAEIDQLLVNEKRITPSRIPYYIGVDKFKPGGFFVLSYMPNKKAIHELIQVGPEGFKFRRETFKDPDRLIRWFKEHFKDAIPPKPRTTQTSAPVTQTVPTLSAVQSNNYMSVANSLTYPMQSNTQAISTWQPPPISVGGPVGGYSSMARPGTGVWGSWDQPTNDYNAYNRGYGQGMSQPQQQYPNTSNNNNKNRSNNNNSNYNNNNNNNYNTYPQSHGWNEQQQTTGEWD